MSSSTPRPDAAPSDANNVKVAIRIRPQLHKELVDMCRVCTAVTPGEPQVTLGKDKAFTFDFCYDLDSTQSSVYGTAVSHLVEGCFEGYNATVLAYGQTGAGKTHTMGTGFDVNVPEDELGVIPRAVRHLFDGIERRRSDAAEASLPPPDFQVNAQFMELYNEDIIDLFDPIATAGGGRAPKSTVRIHEDASGGIYCVGVTTRNVGSVTETMQCLHLGALSRTTASTNMNAQSSRSHAIFSLHVRQQRLAAKDPEDGDAEAKDSQPMNEFETLSAKFHFVDLAGSERLKRTGATGDRAKEGISINCGLLALGNVISALGDKTKKGSHVPYRDSKLTRLLQDSLGGNSRTLMIACISPSDRDFMETLNTLKYANRAKNIKNRVSVNQDKTSAQLAALRAEVGRLQEELLEYKSGKRLADADGVEGYNDLFHENTMLQTENNALRERIKILQDTADGLRVHNIQLLADMEMAKIKDAGGGGGGGDGDGESDEASRGVDDAMAAVVKKYVEEIEELRSKLLEAEATHKRSQLRCQASPSRPATAVSVVGFSGNALHWSQAKTEDDLESLLRMAKKDVDEGWKKVEKKVERKVRRKRGSGAKKGSETTGEEEEEEEDEAEDREGGEEEEEDDVLEIVKASERTQSECSEVTSEYDGSLAEETEDGGVDGDEEEEDEEEDESDGEDEGDEEEDDEEEEEEEEEESSTAEEAERIQDDLAEITNEISLKQRLIEQLETQQRKMALMQANYEDKIGKLHSMIKATALERDEVLASISSLSSQSTEKVEKVKADYDKRLKSMQVEISKLEAAKKEHQKLLRSASLHEKQLQQLQRELKEMKTTKVKLMQQMKVESAKMKEVAAKKNREMNQMKKDKDQKDRKIRSLEDEKRQRDLILKRKQEEVKALRKQIKPASGNMAPSNNTRTSNSSLANSGTSLATSTSARLPGSSCSGGGGSGGRLKEKKRVGVNSGAKSGVTANSKNVLSSGKARSPRGGNSGGAKVKWQNIEKNIMTIVRKRQTIANMEKDMERWVSSREKLCKRYEKLRKKREGLRGVDSEMAREVEMEVDDQMETVKANIDFVQDNIGECQDAIMQMEESKAEGEDVSLAQLIRVVNLEEARYLLESFLLFAIDKGLEASQKEASVKATEAELVQTRQNNVLQQQLLQYMIQDKTDLEVDTIFGADDSAEDQRSTSHHQPLGGSSLASSSSTSPVDSKLSLALQDFSPTSEDFRHQHATDSHPHAPMINGSGESGAVHFEPGGGAANSLFNQLQRRNSKARRKTATTQDLLGMGDGTDIAALPMIEDETEPDPNALFKGIPAPPLSQASVHQQPPEHHRNAFVTTLSLPPLEGDSQPQNDEGSLLPSTGTFIASNGNDNVASDSLILPRSNGGGGGGGVTHFPQQPSQSLATTQSRANAPRVVGLPARNSALSGTFELLRSHSVEDASKVVSSGVVVGGGGEDPNDVASSQPNVASLSLLSSRETNLSEQRKSGSYTVLSVAESDSPTSKLNSSASRLSGFSRNLTSKVLNLIHPNNNNNGNQRGSNGSNNNNNVPSSGSASSSTSSLNDAATSLRSSSQLKSGSANNVNDVRRPSTERSSRTPGREVTVPDREVIDAGSASSNLQKATSASKLRNSTNALSSSTSSAAMPPPPAPPVTNPPSSAPMTRSFPGPGLNRNRNSGGKGGVGGGGSGAVSVTSPSPRLRRKAGSGQNLTQIHPSNDGSGGGGSSGRHGSVGGSGESWAVNTPDATPPASPSAFRRGNVFARLSGRNARNSVADNLGKGMIRPHVTDNGARSSGGGGTTASSSFGRQMSNSSSGGNPSLTCLHVAEGHAKAVLSVDVTDDKMFTGGKDRVAKVWDLSTGQEITTLIGHPNNVGYVKYAPDMKLLFSLSLVYIKVWDLRTQTCIKTLNSSGLINEGHPPLSAANRTNVVPHGESLINSVTVSSSSSSSPLLYSASGAAVRIWDLRRFASVSRLSTGSKTDVLSIITGPSLNSSSDGASSGGGGSVTGGGRTVVTGSRDHTVKIYDVPADPQGVLSARHTLHPPHYDGVQCLAMTDVKSGGRRAQQRQVSSSDTTYLFTGSRDCHIKKWDMALTELVATQNNAHKDWVTDLGIPPAHWRRQVAPVLDEEEDGDLLVSVCRGGAMKLWDVAGSGGFSLVAQEEAAHSKSIAALAFNQLNLFTASADGTVRIWTLGS